ncbi:2-dehydropantoate 2-reductase [Nevskia sp.]|uniref:2-dehydropantoate 2-reductase n=1 Tax=Nevskia sp. TaxID=1929292 RepID=UPI0025F21A1B|nr:2-dehydropantoate 2-reductase [Nevskia sp.]
MSEPEIAVFGAGSVGCYLGGRLLATGANVHFIGRARIAAEVAAHGLHCTDLHGADHRVAPGIARFSEDPDSVRSADVVLVTVKSAATDVAARELAGRLKPGALVISFQNGLRNADVLRAGLPGVTVLTGMVPFNVLARGQGRFHHGSDGVLASEYHPALKDLGLIEVFGRSGLVLICHADMRAVQWGKLLLNLNNAINALSGVPLKEELSQRGFRRCLAAAQAETLALLDAANIPVAQLTKVPPHWLPRLLSLPDFLFTRLAKQMVAIDPLARSSTWEDLEAGRATEVDYINGAVVKLAESMGWQAPVNATLVALIRDAERGGRRDWTARELHAALEAAAR